MRPLFIIVALLWASTCALGSGWVGQGMVNHPNGDTADQQPVVGVDRTGKPWVVWNTNSTDTSLFYSTWNGTGWGRGRAVSANDSGVWGRLRPDLAFDEQNGPWLVWNNGYENNSSVIAACHWDDSQWSAEQRVSSADSTDLYFAPKVSCGGGQVWCVWYGGPTDVSPYSIYASRWDSVAQGWQPEMRVSPLNGNNNWWCDVAVDAQGKPHVVWTETEHLAIYYSSYGGVQWSEPLLVNDSSLVKASAWPDPRIVADRDGVLHMSYTGVLNGAPARDEFYTRNDGSGWTPSVRVTQDTANNYNEWYCDIAASTGDNVWIAFERQGEGPDQFRIYAIHFDGHAWSAEQRLDNDSAYYDVVAAVALDSAGMPWVVWNGTTYSQGNDDVYFNYYSTAGVLDEDVPHPITARGVSVCAQLLGRGRVRVSYTVAGAGAVQVDIHDRLGRRICNLANKRVTAGPHTVEWDGRTQFGKQAPTGGYVCRLRKGQRIATCSFVLLSQQNRE